MKKQNFSILKITLFLSFLFFNNISFCANAATTSGAPAPQTLVSVVGQVSTAQGPGLFVRAGSALGDFSHWLPRAALGGAWAFTKWAPVVTAKLMWSHPVTILPAAYVAIWKWNRYKLWKIRQSLKDTSKLWNWMPQLPVEAPAAVAAAVAAAPAEGEEGPVEPQSFIGKCFVGMTSFAVAQYKRFFSNPVEGSLRRAPLRGECSPAQIVADKETVLDFLRRAINANTIIILDQQGARIAAGSVEDENIRDQITRELEELEGKMKFILRHTDIDKKIKKHFFRQEVQLNDVKNDLHLDSCNFDKICEIQRCCDQRGWKRPVGIRIDADDWFGGTRFFGYNYNRASQDYVKCLEKYLHLRALQNVVASGITDDQTLAHADEIRRRAVSAAQGRDPSVRPAAGTSPSVAAVRS